MRGEGTRERDEEPLDTVLLVMKKVLQRKTFCNFATIVFQIVVHHHHRETCPCVVRLWTYHLGLLMVLDESSRTNLIVKCFWKTSQIWNVFFDDWNHDRSSDVIKSVTPVSRLPLNSKIERFDETNLLTWILEDIFVKWYVIQFSSCRISPIYLYIYICILMFFFHEHC